MTYIERFYLLGKCLALGENETIKNNFTSVIKQEKFDWGQFVSLASDHLVLPSVYLRFKKNGILPFLPEELLDHLQLIYELNLKRNTSILKQIEKINSLFATVDIVPIYMKGAGNILDHIFEDLGERMMGDIDILVSDVEFLQAVSLLKSEGYENEHPYYDDDRIMVKHYPRLVHPTELADIEIHRTPVDIEFSKNFNYATIFPEIKKIETKSPCYVLSDRHKAILNFMHGFMNREARMAQSISFRNLNDLFLLRHRTDIYNVFEEMPEYISQALTYADFMFYSIGLNKECSLHAKSRQFIRRFNFIHSSKFIFGVIWTLQYIWGRIWSGYFYNLVGVFFSIQKRRIIIRKLSNPKWYKLHIKSYTHSFHQTFGQKRLTNKIT